MAEDIKTSLNPIPAPPLPPNTTHQDDLVIAGQRKINLIWEVTQAVIAVTVVLSNMIVGTYQGLHGVSGFVMPPILSNSLFLVIGFYFARTNHTNTGGIGRKTVEEQPYEGR
jgi:hypothetical protein